MMNFSGRSRSPTEEKSSIMDGILELIGDDLEKVDQEFKKNLKSEVPIISTIGEYLLLSGGKRFRAKLLLLSAKLCGYQGNHHISMASLVEFIHTATLLHDDVVDRAELRRGMDSANAIWGNEASVLVGDFLFTKCFSLMVENGNWRILQAMSQATTLLAEGELMELVKTNDLSLSEETYLSIVARKTASLISAATQIGAILGGVPEEKEKALFSFGRDVGMAFQLIDDNLDYISKEEEFGKRIGTDLQEGKITLPLIYTLSQCDSREKALIEKIVESDQITPGDFSRVVELIEKYQGIQYTFKKARRYIENAKEGLHPFSPSKEKEALMAMADYVLERRW